MYTLQTPHVKYMLPGATTANYEAFGGTFLNDKVRGPTVHYTTTESARDSVHHGSSSVHTELYCYEYSFVRLTPIA